MPGISEIAIAPEAEQAATTAQTNVELGSANYEAVADNQIDTNVVASTVDTPEQAANNPDTVSQEVTQEVTQEVKQEHVPITLYENRVQEARRLQSERDKAEAYTRKLLESVMPYVQVDEFGNVLGPRQAQQQAQDMTKIIDELSLRAAAGDTEAIKQMNALIKDQAKQEAIAEFRNMQSQEAVKTQITQEIKNEFPDLFNEQGQPRNDNPIWSEANKIVSQERKGWYDMNNPYHVKSVLEIARSRVILNAYPELKKAIKKEVVMDIKKTGALSTATTTPAHTQEPEKLALSPEQIEVLKKTGKGEPEELRRISNMVKQVKNRSFVIQ